MIINFNKTKIDNEGDQEYIKENLYFSFTSSENQKITKLKM